MESLIIQRLLNEFISCFRRLGSKSLNCRLFIFTTGKLSYTKNCYVNNWYHKDCPVLTVCNKCWTTLKFISGLVIKWHWNSVRAWGGGCGERKLTENVPVTVANCTDYFGKVWNSIKHFVCFSITTHWRKCQTQPAPCFLVKLHKYV